MTRKHDPFTPADTAILLVDHQPGVLNMVRSLPADLVSTNAGLLAALGEGMGIPTVVTTTRETLDFLGTTLPAIQRGAPKAFSARIRRDGTLNAFHDRAFVDAVRATGRPNLLIAGLTTDVCLFHSVVSALETGYRVQVAADASGTVTALGDSVTYQRMTRLGAEVTTTYGILFELYPDLSSAEGRKAEAIAAAAFAPDAMAKAA